MEPIIAFRDSALREQPRSTKSSFTPNYRHDSADARQQYDHARRTPVSRRAQRWKKRGEMRWRIERSSYPRDDCTVGYRLPAAILPRFGDEFGGRHLVPSV